MGSVVGPGTVNLSTGLSKVFPITERVHLRAEGTFTNVLNHTNLGDPNMNISSPSFGLISNTIGSDFGGAVPDRFRCGWTSNSSSISSWNPAGPRSPR